MKKMLTWIMAFAVIGATVGCTDAVNKTNTEVTTEAKADRSMQTILNLLKSNVKTVNKTLNAPPTAKMKEEFGHEETGWFSDERVNPTGKPSEDSVNDGGFIVKYASKEQAEASIADANDDAYRELYGVYVISISSNLTNEQQQELLEAIKKAIG